MTAIEEVLYGDLRRVSYVYRFSAQPVLNRENVAEHSWWTAMISVVLAGEIAQANPNLDSYELMSDVALRAIMHDIEEIGTGDLVREAKYFDSEMRADFRRVEEHFASALFGKFDPPLSYQLYAVWKNAKHSEELAGRIVAAADILCVLAYVRHERLLGNALLTKVESECLRLLHDKFSDDELIWQIIKPALREGERHGR